MINWFIKHSVAITLATGMIVALTTVIQTWVSASQEFPLPQVKARSLSTLHAQLEQRRTSLTEEIKTLDSLLNDIEKAEAALRAPPNTMTEHKFDSWWVSAVKTLAVYIVLVFSAIISIFAVVIDIVALAFGYDFPLISAIWNWSWDQVTIDWFWSRSTDTGFIGGLSFIMAFGAIGPVMQWVIERNMSKTDENTA